LTSKDELPSDINAEKAILGGIFLDNELFFEDAEDLTASDFFLSSHETIFRVMNELMYGNVEGVANADIITISAELRRRKELDGIGGVNYLASLTEGLPRRLNLREYVQIVKTKAKLRKLLKAGQRLYLNAKQVSANADELVEQIQRELLAIEADQVTTAVPVGDVTFGIEKNIMEMRNLSLDKVEMNLTWGIEALDAKTKGAFGAELTILGGDSGSGKTLVAIQMALENALKGTPVGIFSMEMSKEQLVKRLYPLLSSIITASHMRDPRGMTLHTHVPEMRKIAEVIKKLPIYIDDTSPLTLSKFLARIKMMIRKWNVKLFVGDYLQLLQVPGQKELDQVRAVVFGCRDFVKKEPERHILLLSQYAKEQGFMKKKRRTKGDLYGGAVIHQAAQNVLLITVENPDKKEPGSNLDVEIMIDKQREGPPGRVVCQRDSQSLRYIPAAPEPEKKPDEQPKRDAKQRKRTKDSGGEEETGTGFLRENQA
jgi:replicative DNA helicase